LGRTRRILDAIVRVHRRHRWSGSRYHPRLRGTGSILNSNLFLHLLLLLFCLFHHLVRHGSSLCRLRLLLLQEPLIRGTLRRRLIRRRRARTLRLAGDHLIRLPRRAMAMTMMMHRRFAR
jgi:hypothetical protein